MHLIFRNLLKIEIISPSSHLLLYQCLSSIDLFTANRWAKSPWKRLDTRMFTIRKGTAIFAHQAWVLAHLRLWCTQHGVDYTTGGLAPIAIATLCVVPNAHVHLSQDSTLVIIVLQSAPSGHRCLVANMVFIFCLLQANCLNLPALQLDSRSHLLW